MEGGFVDTASLETLICFLSVFQCSATSAVRMTENQSTLFTPDDFSVSSCLSCWVFLHSQIKFHLGEPKLGEAFEGHNMTILFVPSTRCSFRLQSIKSLLYTERNEQVWGQGYWWVLFFLLFSVIALLGHFTASFLNLHGVLLP